MNNIRKAIFGAVLFVSTLGIGYFAVSFFSQAKLAKNPTAVPVGSSKSNEPPVSGPAPDELEYAEMPDSPPPNAVELERIENGKIRLHSKLLEIGEAYHGDQVAAKTGESWIGLFRDGDRYFLKTTSIKITKVRDEIVDDENSGVETGKTVTTKMDLPAVFLLKNVAGIRDGEVETLYYADPDNDADFQDSILKVRTVREFNYNDSHYTVRVDSPSPHDDYLGKGSKLVIDRDGEEQVLRYLPFGCNDCSWTLGWVGDIDRDGKLDFYFDLTGHYNITSRRLFLSSRAAKGQLLKFVAEFWTNGC